MDWLNKINCAMEYIEENLKNEIDYHEVSKIACCSRYHFSRMFSSITGFSLSDYIRRRRLSVSAFELQNTDIKIIDLALKYGYDSPDSFTRAFKKLHGITPSCTRKNGYNLKAIPKLSFQMQIEGDIEMEYRIEKLNFKLKIIGFKSRVKTKNAFREIPKLWSEAKRSGMIQQLTDMSWENPKCKLESLLGICGEESSISGEYFDYLMGVRYENDFPDNMESLILPECTWAVFPNVVEAWKRLYTEWLPISGFDFADLPCIECYYPPEHNPKDELWVPIKK